MAFETVNSTAQFRKWALWSKGDAIIFRLKGFKHGEYKGKPTTNFLCEVLEEVNFLDYKNNPIEVGATLSLSLPMVLEEHITEDEVGSVFKLEYLGKKMNAAQDNSYHTYDLGIDRDYDANNGTAPADAAETSTEEPVDFNV